MAIFAGDQPSDGVKCSALLSLAKIVHIISRNLETVQGKLLLITNRKPYMGFRLVQKSVTLNDLERSSGHYFEVKYLASI